MLQLNKSYYQTIMDDHKASFINCFNESWNKYLLSIESKYSNSYQISSGHRLRPLLAAWGYGLATPLENMKFDKVADVAISVELVHKASIIADDIIDGDTARRGKPSFHIEHNEHKAIIFTVFLLGLSVKTLINQFSKQEYDSSHLVKIVRLFSETICDMSLGALKELDINENAYTNIEEIKEIIDFETVSIIKNSFLLGYLISGNYNKQAEPLIEEIGAKCGYIFQLLNDAEPFSRKDKNKEYKGNINFDINKSRKNITFSYLYTMLNSKEKQAIKTFDSSNNNYILELYTKYDMKSFLINEVLSIKSSIEKDIKTLVSLTNNILWGKDFGRFIDYIVNYCTERLL